MLPQPTRQELIAAADAQHDAATASILAEQDALAKPAYEAAAALYAQAGDEQNAGYMRECAEACCV